MCSYYVKSCLLKEHSVHEISFRKNDFYFFFGGGGHLHVYEQIHVKSWHSTAFQMLKTGMICVIHETPLTSLYQFLSGSNTPLLSGLSVPHSPIPNSIISPYLYFIPETMVLDIGKHTFNYPWLHTSLKYLHCTTPQGDTVHDLSPNLFMGHHLGRDLLPL